MFENLLSNLETHLPELVSRERLAKETGLFSPRTLANWDSSGCGIRGILCGKRIMYTKADAIDWLRAYLERQTLRAGKFNTGSENHE